MMMMMAIMISDGDLPLSPLPRRQQVSRNCLDGRENSTGTGMCSCGTVLTP